MLVEDNRVLGEALRDHLEAMGHDTEWRKGLIESVSATMGDVTLLGNDGKKRVGGNSDQFGCHSIPLRRCADTVNVSGES